GRPALNEQGGRSCSYLLPAAFLRWHFGTFRQTRNGHNPIARAFKIQDSHTLRVTADLTKFIYLASKHFAVSGHEHDLVAVAKLKKSDGKSVSFSGLHANDALSPSSLDPILVHWRAFSVAALSNREDLSG